MWMLSVCSSRSTLNPSLVWTASVSIFSSAIHSDLTNERQQQEDEGRIKLGIYSPSLFLMSVYTLKFSFKSLTAIRYSCWLYNYLAPQFPLCVSFPFSCSPSKDKPIEFHCPLFVCFPLSCCGGLNGGPLKRYIHSLTPDVEENDLCRCN